MGESQLREAEVVLRSEAVFTGMDDRARPAAVGMAGDRVDGAASCGGERSLSDGGGSAGA